MDIISAIQLAEERFGPLFLLVNNAGIMGAMGSFEDMGVSEFESTLAVNLTSVFLGTKHAIRYVEAIMYSVMFAELVSSLLCRLIILYFMQVCSESTIILSDPEFVIDAAQQLEYYLHFMTRICH